MQSTVLAILAPILLFVACVVGLAVVLLVMGNCFSPGRKTRVKRMPYESGMDPIHDTRRQFDVRFHLMAIAFLVFDVELLFLYPWAVTAQAAKLAASQPAASAVATSSVATAAESADSTASTNRAMDATVAALRGTELVENRDLVFPGVMVFIALLTLGFIYDWRKGIFRWR
ncbi:MAG: NADH-quinone oxidoreductase subunit A [Pirellulales bacterium]|nr:NADH-quinone oxidoreductase subunit A [Pirellulales bacterium]